VAGRVLLRRPCLAFGPWNSLRNSQNHRAQCQCRKDAPWSEEPQRFDGRRRGAVVFCFCTACRSVREELGFLWNHTAAANASASPRKNIPSPVAAASAPNSPSAQIKAARVRKNNAAATSVLISAAMKPSVATPQAALLAASRTEFSTRVAPARRQLPAQPGC
jgi:hypothetical protein